MAALEQHFGLRNLENKDGLEWVEAVPKSTDSGFERVRLGFAGNELRAMELVDSFGQTTSLVFSRVERGLKLEAATFRFTPPAGADVLGD